MTSPLDRIFADPGEPPRPGAPQLVVKNRAVPSAPTEDEEAAALAELQAAAAPPDRYRAFLSRSRPVLAFALIERSGTMHGFQYHTLRHPRHETREGQEYLSFHADGQAVVIEGHGLAVMFQAMLRHVLVQMREHGGEPAQPGEPIIRRLAVVDPNARQDSAPAFAGRVSPGLPPA